MDPMMENFAQFIVNGYATIVAFFIGWFLPRGNTLRKVQLYFLTKIHDFLAWEGERIGNRIDTTKQKIKR